MLHGLIFKEQSQMLNLKLFFVNSWLDLQVLCEIGLKEWENTGSSNSCNHQLVQHSISSMSNSSMKKQHLPIQTEKSIIRWSDVLSKDIFWNLIYKRMSNLFYKMNGFNKPSLKYVFIASLPSELQSDLQRKLTATNISIVDISLGKIFQMAMLCLDKICEQKEFFKDLMEDKKSFSAACKKPYLKIECKNDKKFVCQTKKKKHF